MSSPFCGQCALPGLDTTDLPFEPTPRTRPTEQGDDTVTCPNCRKSFTTGKPSDRKRHWRPLVKCPKKDCSRTFRTDKADPFLKHLDNNHDELDMAECRHYFEVMKDALKAVTITNICKGKGLDCIAAPFDDINSEVQQAPNYAYCEDGTATTREDTKESRPYGSPVMAGVSSLLIDDLPLLKGEVSLGDNVTFNATSSVQAVRTQQDSHGTGPSLPAQDRDVDSEVYLMNTSLDVAWLDLVDFDT